MNFFQKKVIIPHVEIYRVDTKDICGYPGGWMTQKRDIPLTGGVRTFFLEKPDVGLNQHS